ncbi:hypothetical protein [Legionella micdadei]|uniref:Uncharacterized protein n=1 Tax=Legionella micdadei TaxID=451 RepID=A0A098GCT4_LEGMI|nr:hypothetical protein [Legionella micdadei]ARG98500.1 hypothetical protein B6N58_12980 [Legionella micdadei]KTD30289.1 hypothetical protein Lmic_0040 [Legionella micdadei]CEG59810.1 exported protein of unknown function [Legionella micdadei]SCY51054.1 hypothetical protein SAMN02982997_01902 [Legionella micdadei]
MIRFSARSISSLISSFLLLLTTISYAQDNLSFKLFISNNTAKMQMREAYTRLTSSLQEKLKNGIIDVLQKNQVEQGKFKTILGVYQMRNTQAVTADNGVLFSGHMLGEKMIFALSKYLAKKFNQESIAIFIRADEAPIGDTILVFALPPTITEAVSLIQKKLPSTYGKAFSIHLSNTHTGFASTRVTAVEWLGQKTDVGLIRKAFPKDTVIPRHGKAFLAYQDGSKSRL